MKTLESDLVTLSKLDDYRKQAQRLRNQGHQTLKRLIGQKDVKNDKRWHLSGDEVEAALVVQVKTKDFGKKQKKTSRKKSHTVEPLNDTAHDQFIEELTKLKLTHLFAEQDHEKVPVLVAARAMQALVNTSTYAFSKTTLLCYYRIVREIYSADSPDWSTGGAKAGNGGESTAFMTGECVRAIATFARTHHRTSDFFKSTHELHLRRVHLSKLTNIEHWCDKEIEHIGLAWYTSTNVHLTQIALKLKRDPPEKEIDFNYINDYFKDFPDHLIKSIKDAKKNFLAALREVKAYRLQEEKEAVKRARAARKKGKEADRHFIRSESAHLMAQSVVQQAVDMANKALELCRGGAKMLDKLGELAKLFATITQQINQILEPAKRFLGAVLDRELTAAATTSQPAWDARELVFAAVSYSAVTGWKQDERLTRACSLLSKAISEQGLFPAGHPFHTTCNGYSLHASGFEVARGFAQLLQKVDFQIEPQLIGRILQLFSNNVLAFDDDHMGWHAEDPPVPKKTTLWVTAIAVLALDRIVRLLDHKINEKILEHFTAKRFDREEKGLRLESLVFSDYAACYAPPELKRDLPVEQQRNGSIAIILEQMRAHILNTKLPKHYSQRKFSCLLFGPPGTGKTTLIEALACSSNLPLIQITPSDIAVAGEAAIESRAKMIFEALSMLKEVVIIFDEFEPILLKREANAQNEERSIFTFLTPGMLPKLKKLYEAAKQQRIAYCLVTNHYEKLDEAAIRKGRFDDHIDIYHPDFLSRAGAFLDNLHKLPKAKGLTRKQADRFEKVVKWTEQMSVEELVRDVFNVLDEKTQELRPYADFVIKDSALLQERMHPVATSVSETARATPVKLWVDKLERDLTNSTLAEVFEKLKRNSVSE